MASSKGKKVEDKPVPLAKRAKAAQDAAPDMNERVASFHLALNKKMGGRGQIQRASECAMPYLTKRYPTGLLSLDVALGGGFPAGGLSQIAGPKNSCKTYLYWQVIRQLQHILGDRMKVLLAMTEMRADRQQGRLAGVEVALHPSDIESLNKGRIKNGWPAFTDADVAALQREVGQIDELHGESAEVLYDGILQAVELNIYHLIVIDSFGSIMTGAEADAESLDEKFYGGAAAINTRFLRKLTALLTMNDAYGLPREVCVLGINQIRANIGDRFREFKTTGGFALEHAKFVDLWLTSGQPQGYHDQLYGSKGTDKQFVQTGKEINWKIEKGKAGIHEGEKGSFIYDFRINQADFYLDTLVAGVRHGVVETAGAWLRLPNPDNPGQPLLNCNGKDKFIEAMVQDVQQKAATGDSNTYLNYIREKVFRAKDINISYDWK